MVWDLCCGCVVLGLGEVVMEVAGDTLDCPALPCFFLFYFEGFEDWDVLRALGSGVCASSAEGAS